MKKYHQSIPPKSTSPDAKSGFTVIEVMLFLGITGLMLIGVLGGTYSSIARQRYNDSLRSFSEFLRTIYAEVLSPESLGQGNSNQNAIYGKVVVFGLDQDNPNVSEDERSTIYTATITGNPHPPTSAKNFVEDLRAAKVTLFCGQTANEDKHIDSPSTLSDYKMQWGANLFRASDDKSTSPLKGTLIIARSPSSGTVHAAFTDETFPINTDCQPESYSASSDFHDYVEDPNHKFDTSGELTVCIKSENSSITRGVSLDLASRSTSAIKILTEDESAEKGCQ